MAAKRKEKPSDVRRKAEAKLQHETEKEAKRRALRAWDED